ncbi:hypothetical protein ES703_76139 [subsurface metagenome]
MGTQARVGSPLAINVDSKVTSCITRTGANHWWYIVQGMHIVCRPIRRDYDSSVDIRAVYLSANFTKSDDSFLVGVPITVPFPSHIDGTLGFSHL